MNKETREHAAEVLRAIGHPLRLQIIDLLRTDEMCVGDIVEALDEKQAVISCQLNLMKDKGILVAWQDGGKVYYRIACGLVERLAESIALLERGMPPPAQFPQGGNT